MSEVEHNKLLCKVCADEIPMGWREEMNEDSWVCGGQSMPGKECATAFNRSVFKSAYLRFLTLK